MMRSFSRLALFAILALPGCFSLDRDGDGFIDVPPPGGYERDEISCSDGRDNDQDGRIDCQDEDCLMGQFCGEQIPLAPWRGPEDTFEACRDGIDNDDDGQFDCGDRNCQSIMELCCSSEVDDASCSDGIDNDGNGFTDCQDFSCRRNRYVTVCERETNCTDRIDNDGDRRTDCNDPDCEEDPACLPPPEADCANGSDDNGDGRIDCADRTCQTNPICLGPERTVAFCQDGFDNDGDGFTDCNDFDCSMSADPEVRALCGSGGEEHSLEECTNGRSDDGDPYVDCADRDCTDVSRGASQEAADYCASIAENTLERCSDGIDNDGNGFTDCQDFSCSRSEDEAILDHCYESGEASYANCKDRRDNDGNGFIDCNDFSCQFVQVGWGVELCDTVADCPEGSQCRRGTCVRPCSAGPCPAGTQCDPTSQLCIQSCAFDAECDPGESCYQGRCLALRGPCIESAWVAGDVTLIGDFDERFSRDATLAEQIRMAVAGCTDGIDNDGDGFTDCEDWECNYNPRVVGTDGQPLCRFRGGRTCVLGPRAGAPCASDADCGDLSGACGPAGPAGTAFVCP